MKLRRLVYTFGLFIAFGLGIFVAPSIHIEFAGMRFEPSTLVARAETERPDLTTFWKAWDLAQQNFVYRDALDPTRMMYGAIRGMIESLGDDGHTRFLTPDEVKVERSSLRGEFEGIGAEVNMRNGRPSVVTPIEGSPAERAGIRPGDAILRVDGVDVTAITLTDLVSKVRGPRGSTVILTVIHQGDSNSVDIPVQRDSVKVKTVTWVMIPGTTIAHVKVNRFGQNTTKDLRTSLTESQTAGATQLVLDLRNNPGGLLTEAVSTASQFLKSGDALLEENAKGERKHFPIENGGLAVDIPMVVLVNQGSASASEIVAAAIQDYQRATIIGESTAGTGTVLTPFTLADNSQIYLGIAQWLSPAGRIIRKVGVKPDVVVSLIGDARPISPNEIRALSVGELAISKDAQLMRAIQSVAPPAPAQLLPAA